MAEKKKMDTPSSKADGSKSDKSAPKTARQAADALEGDAAELSQRFEDLRDEAVTFGEALSGAAQDMGNYVREQARTRPYTTLGVAAGAGFILGGGLTPRISRLLLRLGTRLAANAVLREVTRSGPSL